MKKKLMLKVLKKLDEESQVPSREELGLNEEQYGEILEIMLLGGLIADVNVTRAGQGNKVNMIWKDNAKITVKGIEYYEQNLGYIED